MALAERMVLAERMGWVDWVDRMVAQRMVAVVGIYKNHHQSELVDYNLVPMSSYIQGWVVERRF